MRALTLLQPWASLIIFGPKRIENRTWKPSPNVLKVGERFAIHAGKGWDKRVPEWIGLEFPQMQFPKSVILGTVRFTGIVTKSSDRYFSGPFGWTIDEIRKAPVKIEILGKLGLWKLPDEIVERLAA